MATVIENTHFELGMWLMNTTFAIYKEGLGSISGTT